MLATVKKNGKVLVTSGELCKKGKCTFDGLIVVEEVRAKDNPDFMVALVKAIAKADADYRANAEGVDRRPGQGRRGREVVGREARGRPGDDGALRLPDACRSRRRPTWLGGGANGGAAKALAADRRSSSRTQGRIAGARARLSAA